LCGETLIVATRAVRSAIVIGFEAPTLNGQIGSAGIRITIGAEGITITGNDCSDLTMYERSATVELIVDAAPDNGEVIEARVTFGKGQIRRFSTIAWQVRVRKTLPPEVRRDLHGPLLHDCRRPDRSAGDLLNE
jgi:hypothetical protein